MSQVPADSCFRAVWALAGLLTLDHIASASLNVANALQRRRWAHCTAEKGTYEKVVQFCRGFWVSALMRLEKILFSGIANLLGLRGWTPTVLVLRETQGVIPAGARPSTSSG